ncbi:MAG: four helix bundle protein [Candidatus Velamenicoccus archaeovorus]
MVDNAKDSKAYESAFDAAMEVFWLTKKYPKEELHSLADQLRKASRSVAVSIREGLVKKPRYRDIFVRHVVDALGFCEETKTWLDFSFECRYLGRDKYGELSRKYDEIRIMLYQLVKNWKKL